MKKVKPVFKNSLLVQVRKEMGMTQAEMAKECKVSTGTYQYWELGRNSPSNPNKRALISCLQRHKMPYKLRDFYDDYLIPHTIKEGEPCENCEYSY